MKMKDTNLNHKNMDSTRPRHNARLPKQAGAKKGTIIVWVMVAITILSGVIFAGISILRNTTDFLETNMEYYGQSTAIAKAGLIDALGWFRRQAGQPVIIFKPLRDLTAIPPVNDTDDPAIGIVRDLEVDTSRNLYGHYEVITSSVIDVTAQKGLQGSGTVWYIECTGYLYLKLDEFKPYNVWPNRVISSVRLATEIRRISIVLPSLSAVFAKRPNGTISNIGNNTRIAGGSHYGISYPAAPPPIGTLTIDPGADVTGTPTATVAISPVNDTCFQVFGVYESELESLADYDVTDIAELPNPIPDYKIVFFRGNATFDAAHNFRGTGIFYITGNLTIGANSNSAYNGIIYCKGVYTQNAPSMINGSIITQSRLDIFSTGDISEVDYDGKVLQQVQNYTGSYRLNKGFYQLD